MPGGRRIDSALEYRNKVNELKKRSTGGARFGMSFLF